MRATQHIPNDAGLIRGLSSLDDDRGFKDKFLDGEMEQAVGSEAAQIQLGQHPLLVAQLSLQVSLHTVHQQLCFVPLL